MTRFVSTRGGAPSVPFSQAMEHGLAPDGGLYVPESFPTIDPRTIDPDATLTETAEAVLRPFLEGDELSGPLPEILAEALSFPTPLVHLDGFSALELFHGPTAAFKDVGARFMAACFARLRDAIQTAGAVPSTRTVLVATSGDTGSAVASAFHRRPGFQVVILFPSGGVSPRQRHQLTCFGENVHAFAVRGTFDDCQRILERAFGMSKLTVRLGLTTANSINVARLLPQTVYYAAASLRYLADRGERPTLVVPAGNVGNSLAALWARRIGFPLGDVVMVSNANRALPDFFETGRWEPRSSVRTLANAMDVGNPSNMERVFHLQPDPGRLREEVTAISVDDDSIRDVIRREAADHGRVWDPHTATAVQAVSVLALEGAIVVATAHPAKFDEIVEPLVGEAVPVPAALASLLDRPAHFTEIEPELGALVEALTALPSNPFGPERT